MTLQQARKALEQFLEAKGAAPAFLVIGKVIAVDADAATCDVAPLNGGADWLDVRLQPLASTEQVGLLLLPKVGAHVTVAQLDHTEAFLISCQEIEQVRLQVAGQFSLHIDAQGHCQFNNGDHGGLVIADRLRQQIDKNTQILQTFLSLLAAPIVEPGNGSPSAFQQVLNAALQGKPTADLSQITNDQIKH